MVKMGLVEISAPPNRPFLGAEWSKFFRPVPKGFQSPRKKFLMPPNPFWDSVGLPESKTAEIRPKNAILQKFLHPKIDLFGAGWSKFFRPAPKGSQRSPKKFLVVPNSFLGSEGLSESKIADFRPKNRNF